MSDIYYNQALVNMAAPAANADFWAEDDVSMPLYSYYKGFAPPDKIAMTIEENKTLLTFKSPSLGKVWSMKYILPRRWHRSMILRLAGTLVEIHRQCIEDKCPCGEMMCLVPVGDTPLLLDFRLFESNPPLIGYRQTFEVDFTKIFRVRDDSFVIPPVSTRDYVLGARLSPETNGLIAERLRKSRANKWITVKVFTDKGFLTCQVKTADAKWTIRYQTAMKDVKEIAECANHLAILHQSCFVNKRRCREAHCLINPDGKTPAVCFMDELKSGSWISRLETYTRHQQSDFHERMFTIPDKAVNFTF